jgi:hypothetical protein
VSAGAKKSTTLDTNYTNTVNAALSKSIYVRRILTVGWEQLSVAGRYWGNGRYHAHYHRTSYSEYYEYLIGDFEV